MRVRRLCGAAAMAAVAGSAAVVGSTVFADPAADEATPGEGVLQKARADTVVLPTGDAATVHSNGAVSVRPAGDREGVGFLTPSAKDGSDDVVVVPMDVAAEVADGRQDPRRYNVTRLIEAGHAEADDVSDVELDALDARPYRDLTPADTARPKSASADDVQKVTVTFKDRSGDVPEFGRVIWGNLDDPDDWDGADVEDGVATFELPSGDYALAYHAGNPAEGDARGEILAGFTSVTVGDGPVETTVDAAAAQQVNAEIDRPDARLGFQDFSLEAVSEADPNGYGEGMLLDGDSDAYVTPGSEIPGYDVGLFYRATLTGSDGDGPYTYDLVFPEADGVPEDTSYQVADDELAKVDMSYRGLKDGQFEGESCDVGYAVDNFPYGHGAYCLSQKVDVPSTQTRYYTADDKVAWESALTVGEFADGFLVNGFTAASGEPKPKRPGPSEQSMPVSGGPLSATPPDAARTADDQLWLVPEFGGKEADDETVSVVGFTGDAVLKRDGEEIRRAEDFDFGRNDLGFQLPSGDSGRYTLTLEVDNSTKYADLPVAASQEWEFDSKQVDPDNPDGFDTLPVPAVNFEGGRAHRGAEQDVTLTTAVPEGLPDVSAEDMSFEVSYDDGESWTDVEIVRDGNTATATLRHPDDAEFVSVRMSVETGDGVNVSHTAIRSYALT
ncbi:MAG: hypothetical protein ACRDXX_20235 [Stackebrandtia sp.]